MIEMIEIYLFMFFASLAIAGGVDRNKKVVIFSIIISLILLIKIVYDFIAIMD